MRGIFYELIQEAIHGKVMFNGKAWPIAFNTTIFKNGMELTYTGDEKFSTLVIKNEEYFFELLREYLLLELRYPRRTPHFDENKERNHVKFIIAYLFVNASTEDFLDPEGLIKRNIEFLKDKTFKDLNEQYDINGHFLNSQIEVKNVKNSITMDTPYKLDISLVKEVIDKKLEYPLASVSYGIKTKSNGEKICYIYSLLKAKRKEHQSEEDKLYEKKMARLLYKLNDGISEYETTDYFEYKEDNTRFYPENISDVTPSFVLSIIVFLTLLQKEGIHEIKVIPFLPLRYLSRDIIASRMNDLDTREIIHNRNNEIQDNATNKFIRTFMRAAFHMEDLQVMTYPYEVDEFLTCYLTSKQTELNNEILNDIANIIYGEEPTLRK